MAIVHLKNSAGVITEYTVTPPQTLTGITAGTYTFTEGLTQQSVTVTASGGGTPAPTLGALSLSPSTATVGAAYSGAVSGKTASSSLALSGAGAAGLSVSGTTVSGTPTSAGTVNIIETLAGATGSPRTSSGVLTVAASGGGTPAPLVSDSFTGTDNTLLTSHAPETGGTWIVQPGTTIPSGGDARITSGAMYAPGTGAVTVAYQNTTPLPANCYVQFVLEVLSNSSSSNDNGRYGVTLRASDSAATFYLVRQNIVGTGGTGQGTWDVFRFVGGTGTAVGTFAATSQNIGTKTARFEISDVGATVVVKGYLDGASMGADVVDSNASRITAAGQAGVRIGHGGVYVSNGTTTGGRYNSFEAGAL